MPDSHLDACLTLVSNGQRRRIIEQLRHGPAGPVAIDDLVDTLYSSNSPSVTGGRTDRDQLASQLVHVHLPKLAAHDVVEYESCHDRVWYRPDGRVEAVLDGLPAERFTNPGEIGPEPAEPLDID